ncbi:1-hydroxy-2-methyl-2-butenyl 4-diphosphate reductase [Streptomyces sp. WMMC500]|uniref:phosphorylase family protein n=1 Tax=Streptomyces sp. WMMC500 TaxID=3015154 RepID=UPI00248D1EE0|nr:1-hydroxy-2-methyl-2-butenyl 4-diphosphate reductase [Streptomyces sp. WMMC500]WBB61354.1 1-hydroxy-2-methyl-2-butenyl 4-diphosphate reductase [Streptomyces sp. WMMC500]
MPDAPAPLLVVCALGIERRALASGTGSAAGGAGDAGPVEVLRTGMGPERAERAVARRLAEEPYHAAPVIAAGFCAGLLPEMRPGDVVVADAVRADREGAGTTGCPDNGPLLDALALLGARVHTGLLLGTDHVVRGAAGRARLRERGAVAVDMESAVTLHTAAATAGAAAASGFSAAAAASGTRPVAAVRVVVDAPQHELVRFGTLRGGIAAYRVLSSVLPAFFEWHRQVMIPRRRS